jgi:hypothetical protein
LRPVPDLTERRQNRELLKQQLAKEAFGTECPCKVKQYESIRLILPPEIKAKMNAQLILEDNIKDVIRFAQTTGTKVYDEQSDLYTAHRAQGQVTFWVQYRPAADKYEICNVYFHRMSIKET